MNIYLCLPLLFLENGTCNNRISFHSNGGQKASFGYLSVLYFMTSLLFSSSFHVSWQCWILSVLADLRCTCNQRISESNKVNIVRSLSFLKSPSISRNYIQFLNVVSSVKVLPGCRKVYDVKREPNSLILRTYVCSKKLSRNINKFINSTHTTFKPTTEKYQTIQSVS